MGKLFNLDSPVFSFLNKAADLIWLNILTFICCIPVVTIGASMTALNYVVLKMVRNEEGYITRSYFKSFKENFRQATIIWMIMLAAGLLLGFDLYFFLYMQTEASRFRTIMVTVFGSLTLVYACILTYVFPIQSRFYNPVKKNSV